MWEVIAIVLVLVIIGFVLRKLFGMSDDEDWDWTQEDWRYRQYRVERWAEKWRMDK